MRAVRYYAGNGVYVEDRDPDEILGKENTWAILKHGMCLNRDLEWEYEPMPSNRDDAFARCRFTLREAQEIVYARKL